MAAAAPDEEAEDGVVGVVEEAAQEGMGQDERLRVTRWCSLMKMASFFPLKQ